eukprot:4643135-Pyramimonas_sp.AAC.1
MSRDEATKYELIFRHDAINVVLQFMLEYLTTPAYVLPLETYIFHGVPPGLPQHVDRIWDEPISRIPFHRRGGRVLLAVGEVIFLFWFMAGGLHVAFPGNEVRGHLTDTGFARDPILTDAYALDCRIMSAIKSFDLLRAWDDGVGSEVRGPARRCDAPMQLAVEFMQTSDQFFPQCQSSSDH